MQSNFPKSTGSFDTWLFLLSPLLDLSFGFGCPNWKEILEVSALRVLLEASKAEAMDQAVTMKQKNQN